MNKETPQSRLMHCPTCDNEMHCSVVHHHPSTENVDLDEHYSISTYNNHYILRCEGCHTIFFLHISHCTEDINADGFREEVTTIYPSPPTHVNSIHEIRLDVLGALKERKWEGTYASVLYNEICHAINSKNSIIGMLGIRSLLSEVCRLKTNYNKNFLKNLNKLENEGFLAPKSKDVFSAIIHTGNDAAHNMKIPSPGTLHLCLLVIESLITTLFIVPLHEEEIKKVSRLRNNST